MMKQMRIIINFVLIGWVLFLSTGCGGSNSYEDVVISDMLLYEHENIMLWHLRIGTGERSAKISSKKGELSAP